MPVPRELVAFNRIKAKSSISYASAITNFDLIGSHLCLTRNLKISWSLITSDANVSLLSKSSTG